jgi:hypothetical protein
MEHIPLWGPPWNIFSYGDHHGTYLVMGPPWNIFSYGDHHGAYLVMGSPWIIFSYGDHHGAYLVMGTTMEHIEFLVKMGESTSCIFRQVYSKFL